jgi:anti-sigma regulatory factor (Ser/Thr protein kinase)
LTPIAQSGTDGPAAEAPSPANLSDTAHNAAGIEATAPHAFELILANDIIDLERLGLWIDEVSDTLGVSKSVSFGLHLCFEEAVSNVIRHAYPNTPNGHPSRGDIRVELRTEGPTLLATIEDNGVAFDPTAAADPVQPNSVDEANIGGLGIHLIRQFTTAVHYARVEGANRLAMAFAL